MTSLTRQDVELLIDERTSERLVGLEKLQGAKCQLQHAKCKSRFDEGSKRFDSIEKLLIERFDKIDKRQEKFENMMFHDNGKKCVQTRLNTLENSEARRKWVIRLVVGALIGITLRIVVPPVFAFFASK